MPQHDDLSEEELEIALEEEILERELARRDYHTFFRRLAAPRFRGGFKDGWHIGIIAKIAHQIKYALDNVEDPDVPRIYVVNLPPRHTKSENFSRAIPLWLLAHNPRLDIMLMACEAGLAREHGAWFKNTVLLDPYFKTVFPELSIRQDSQAKERLVTKEGGGVRAFGRAGGGTGFGADFLVIDDPYKNDKEADSPAVQKEIWDWYLSVTRARMSPGGVTVIMHTRWRVDDLAGKVLKMYQEDEEGLLGKICHISFPRVAVNDEYDPFDPTRLLRRKGESLHPARYDDRHAKALKTELFSSGATGRRTWAALYQQNPQVEEGNFFRRKAIMRQLYNPAELPDDLFCYLPTDYAVTEDEDNDQTCLWPFGVDRNGNFWFLPEIFLERVLTDVSIPKTVDLADRHKVHGIFIEKGVIQRATEPALNEEMDLVKKWFTVYPISLGRQDKVLRARGIQARIDRGKVFFPDTRWFHEEVLPQMLLFPNGAHDDVVDTLSISANAIEHIDNPHGGPELPALDDDDPFAVRELKAEKKGNKYDLFSPDRWA